MNEVGKDSKVKYIGFDIWEDADEIEEFDKTEHNAKKRVTEADVRTYLKSYDIELIKGNTRETLLGILQQSLVQLLLPFSEPCTKLFP